ncbi:Conserved_hypothetical protein [Hexamita inflata]|uniref:Uncharacterized protein n=1 Tax=Hexamita inflata TaxID=28002 RepID=A0ABP1K4Q6_9EUKA
MSDFGDFGDDFNFDAPKPKAADKKAKKTDDDLGDLDFGDDFGFDEPKPKPKATTEKKKVQNDDMDFGDDFNFDQPAKPKAKENKKEEPKDDMDFGDDFNFDEPKSKPKAKPAAKDDEFNFGDDDFESKPKKSESKSKKEEPKEVPAKPKAPKKDDDMDFGGDFDFDAKPKKSESKSKKEEPKDEMDFGDDDFNFDSKPAQKTEPAKPKQNDDEFNFGGDDFETKPKKSESKSKKEEPKDDMDFGGDFEFDAKPKKSESKSKKQEPKDDFGPMEFDEPKPKKAESKSKKAVDNDDMDFGGDFEFDTKPKKQVKDDLEEDFAFDTKPKAKPEPKVEPKKSESRAKSAKKDEFAMDFAFDAPKSKESEPKSRASSGKKSFFEPKQEPIKKEEPILQKQPSQTLVKQPSQHIIQNVQKFEPEPQVIPQITQNTIQQQLSETAPVISLPRFEPQYLQNDFQVQHAQIQNIAPAAPAFTLDDIKNLLLQHQPNMQPINDQLSQLKAEITELKQQQVNAQNVTTKMQQLTDNTNQTQKQLEFKSNELMQRELAVQRKETELTFQKQAFVNENEVLDQQKMNQQQQANITNNLIKQSQEVLNVLKSFDQSLERKIDELFATKIVEPKIDMSMFNQNFNLQLKNLTNNLQGQIEQILTVQVGQMIQEQFQNMFRNYIQNLNQNLEQNQIQLINLLQQQQQSTPTPQQPINQQNLAQKIIQDINQNLNVHFQNVLEQLQFLPNAPIQNQDNNNPKGTCQVYVEVVKTLQSKLDQTENDLKTQNQSIQEQTLKLRMAQQEAEHIRYRYQTYEKDAAIKDQRASALEEMNIQQQNRLHQKERDMMIREQQLKLREEDINQLNKQLELKQVQLEKLRLEVNQKRDDLKSQQLLMEVEQEKEEIRQMQDVESKVFNVYRAGSVGRFNPQMQQYSYPDYPQSPSMNGNMSIQQPVQQVIQQPVQYIQPQSQQNQQMQQMQQFQQQQQNGMTYSQIEPPQQVRNPQLDSFQKAKQQLKDVVQRGASASVRNSQSINDPNDADTMQKMRALEISYGIQKDLPRKQAAKQEPLRISKSVDENQQVIQQQQEMINNMMKQMREMQSLNSSQQSTKMPVYEPQYQQQYQAPTQFNPNQGKQKSETPSNADQIINKPFTPLPNNLVNTQPVVEMKPVSMVNENAQSLVISDDHRQKTQVIQQPPVQQVQQVAQPQVQYQEPVKQPVQMRNPTPPPQMTNYSQPKPTYQEQYQKAQQQILQPPTFQAPPAQPQDRKSQHVELDNLRPAASTSAPEQMKMKPITLTEPDKKQTLKAPEFSVGIDSEPQQQTQSESLSQQPKLQFMTAETSGISGLDFDFKPTKPLSGQASQNTNSLQNTASGMVSAQQSTTSPGKKLVSNPFEDTGASKSNNATLKNPFAEFKYDNNAFDVFEDGKSSTSPFFPF